MYGQTSKFFFSLSTFFLYCLAREVLPECKKIKEIFFANFSFNHIN
jgi:hypothetical protein